MAPFPTGDTTQIHTPSDPRLQARIESDGLSAVLTDVTRAGCDRVAAHLTDPTATDSRARYAAWLRRQVSAWAELRLPAVSVAAVDWPLSSVRPQCLDVVGLLVADLRDLAPRLHPTPVPRQADGPGLPPPGVVVAAADLCVRLAAEPARMLDAARAVTAATDQLGSPTRYLTRCADLAERAPGLAREVDRWAGAAGAVQAQLAALTAQRFADRLAEGLDTRVGHGW